ncbi:hypothetical protein [Devosia psychrophila]|jgi:apolipoprotein N-acyltransferase|uniref:VanZ like family protein n=1 Tax=Devosia psychrophila TaxID=728005 RepID=A0A0F5Q1N1_9HYPH|nr:hypothetical protein [Devosia psychrophila]KKC33989.1 hypothetical protein WH91_05415 [Devosia psychrophila]SFD40396.1 hypothetical protein SAMN04488059_1536 [Devosia psychrophila]
MTKTTLRIFAWLAFLFIAFATLSPIGLRPHSVLPVDMERAAAFLAVGLLFALAYPRHLWLAAAVVLVSVVGLEWLQTLHPDRHGREGDALVKLAGAAIGLGCGWLLAQLAARRHRQ